MLYALENAYRGDRFHALRGNLEGLTEAEWTAIPGNHRVEVFGTDPELSIADLVLHIGGGLRMYTNHAFGDRSMKWGDSTGAPADMEGMLAWLDESHAAFVAGVEALTDDAELDALRGAPWGNMLPTRQLISYMTNHQVYHSGEINRQRSLLRGAEGWVIDR